MNQSIHITAIDWALAKGYVMSVRDYSEDEYDCRFSSERAEIIDCIEATELPNVEIHIPDGKGRFTYLATFSVIDEGIPNETINDYSTKPGSEFDKWFEAWGGAA